MLIGLGLGPGDPELLTLKAVRLLREADHVFVPGRLARELVAPYCEPVQLDFPMTENAQEVRQSLERNAAIVAAAAREGLAVFGILGDPNFFSTYSRLARLMEELHPDVECITIPGVSAITAFASIAGIALGGSILVTDSGKGEHRIMLKVRRPAELVKSLRQQGYSRFVLLERMYMKDMRIHRGERFPEESDYMSILYAGREVCS